MKLTILKMNKKKIIGAVCAIALFAGGGVVGAQIYANAFSNAIATLPLSKGGTSATTAGAAATSILGTNYANYDGILPVSKGGTGINGALSTAISSTSTNLQIPTAKAVIDRAPRVVSGSFSIATITTKAGAEYKPTFSGFTSAPKVYLQKTYFGANWTQVGDTISAISTTGFTAQIYNDATFSLSAITYIWTAIGW
jgi:hypothetical protein